MLTGSVFWFGVYFLYIVVRMLMLFVRPVTQDDLTSCVSCLNVVVHLMQVMHVRLSDMMFEYVPT